jgi:charged multivesicular body protein 7
LALGTVVREGVDRGVLVGVKEFDESAYGKGKGWGLSPWELLSWGARMLGLAGGASGEDRVPVGGVVVLSNVEEAGREFARRVEGIRSRTDRIYSKAAFREEFGDVLGKERILSESDLEIFLRFLSRDKDLLAYDGETVKLKASGDKTVSSITAEDTTIASLKTLIKDLELQTTVLTRRVNELSIAAKDAVTRKNRVAALAALRSKKLAETTLTKRHATLGQLEEMFSKIEQAADQVELVNVMETSSRVLSGLNKEVGGSERVDDVVDQLRDQMGQVDKVGNVITEVGQGAGAVDETEVDDELEAMEREEREKREAKERAEREEKEKLEVAETRRRLAALEVAEREAAKSKEEVSKKSEGSITEQSVEDTVKQMQGMSLEPGRIAETS